MASVRIEGDPGAPVVLTCEHASAQLPEGWRWPEEDRWIADTHWASDPGAAAVARGLAGARRWPAVLCTFTRLLVDPNRDPEHRGLIRTEADGRAVALNQGVSPDDIGRRLSDHHASYHTAADRMVAAHPEALVLSVHSFTPVYEGGPPRPMEIGVLFDRDEALAVRLARSLTDAGWRTALNAPYSGRGGLMYAADRHATAHGRAAIEIEVRQDVATDPAARRRLVPSLIDALEAAGPPWPRGP